MGQDINSSATGQNGGKIADGNFKCNVINENLLISIFFSLKFVP